MAKGNGQGRRPRTGAPMIMAGPITLQLTRESADRLLNGGDVRFNRADVYELDLTVKIGDKDSVLEFRPYFVAHRSAVTIENDIAMDSAENEAAVHDDMEVHICENEERAFSFMVNPRQAAALAEALSNYAKAWEIGQALKKSPVPIQPLA